MKKTIIPMAVLLSVFLLPLLSGCMNKTGDSLSWEVAGDFQTRDINKAQIETPFPLITPDYIPPNVKTPPMFKGILRRYQINVTADLPDAPSYAVYSMSVGKDMDHPIIMIGYPGTKCRLIIEESTKTVLSAGEPEFDPERKYVDILGIKAILGEGDYDQGSWANLSFQKDGISFLLTSENITSRELLSVAESMISKKVPDIQISHPDDWPWGEAYGRYYTKDIALAQKETAFRIITPGYIPAVFDQRLPYIEGQLDKQQAETDTVKLLYFSAIMKESSFGSISWNGGPEEKTQDILPVILEISEQLMPFADTIEPNVKKNLTKVPGTEITVWTQDLGDMQYSKAIFKQNDIYFSIKFYNLDLDEIFKVVESIR